MFFCNKQINTFVQNIDSTWVAWGGVFINQRWGLDPMQQIRGIRTPAFAHNPFSRFPAQGEHSVVQIQRNKFEG